VAGLFDFDNRMKPLFEVHGRPKKSNVKDINVRGGNNRAKATRVASEAPEVVIKVTGHARGAKHLRRLMQYITREGELVAENEAGESITGKDAVAEFANDWNATIGKRKANTRDTMNIVLSMPASTDPQAVFNAARDLAKHEFAKNHEYIMVLHTFETDPSPNPSPNPHVHLVVKSVGFDGRRLNPRKADLQRWRELFAERLRDQGVEAEATPRMARGVVKKATKQPLHHAEKRNQRTRRMESAVKEVANEVAGRKVPAERPWEAAIRSKQELVRSTWADAAKSLEGSPDASDKLLAERIRTFVSKMPAIKTRRDEISSLLREQLVERLPERQQMKEPSKGDIER